MKSQKSWWFQHFTHHFAPRSLEGGLTRGLIWPPGATQRMGWSHLFFFDRFGLFQYHIITYNNTHTYICFIELIKIISVYIRYRSHMCVFFFLTAFFRGHFSLRGRSRAPPPGLRTGVELGLGAQIFSRSRRGSQWISMVKICENGEIPGKYLENPWKTGGNLWTCWHVIHKWIQMDTNAWLMASWWWWLTVKHDDLAMI